MNFHSLNCFFMGFFLLLCLFFTFPHISEVQGANSDIFIFIIQKEEQKRQSRWSLGEWLLTKKKMQLMDQWLALNTTQDYFEGVMGGDMGRYSIEAESASKTYSKKRGELKLYVSIIGFEGQYESSEEGWKSHSMGIGLRILGKVIQGTHLTVQGGYRNLSDSVDQYNNPYLGGELSLYLLSFFGVNGVYHHYSPKEGKTTGVVLRGKRILGEVFLDLSFLRIYGQKFDEELQLASVTKRRKGVFVGAKIFF